MTKLVDIPRFALTSSCFQSYCIFPRSKDIRGVYIEWVSSARMYLVGHLKPKQKVAIHYTFFSI